MLYGTFAATHFLARLMMSVLVVVRGAVSGAEGGPDAPSLFSGPTWPWGLTGCGSTAVAPPVARPAACAAAWPAPQVSTIPAAVASTSARRAPCAAGCPPWRTGSAAAVRRRCAQPGHPQSAAGSYSSKTGTVMRLLFPWAGAQIFRTSTFPAYLMVTD